LGESGRVGDMRIQVNDVAEGKKGSREDKKMQSLSLRRSIPPSDYFSSGAVMFTSLPYDEKVIVQVVGFSGSLSLSTMTALRGR
jgi:hypothetical protein